eukprot:5123634-Amphidinium_carterae.1
MRKLSGSYDSNIDLVLFVGQSPVLKLDGSQQDKLFLEMVRVKDLCVKMFRTKVCWVIENVDGLKEGYLEQFNLVLDCKPSVIDARDFTHVSRPRVYWMSGLLSESDVAHVQVSPLKQDVTISCERLRTSAWVDAGWNRTTECDLPGFSKAGALKKRPARSRGMSEATQEDVE